MLMQEDKPTKLEVFLKSFKSIEVKIFQADLKVISVSNPVDTFTSQL